MKKRVLALTLALALTVGLLAGCGNSGNPSGNNGGGKELSAVQKIIQEAQNMSWEELAAKAIE